MAPLAGAWPRTGAKSPAAEHEDTAAADGEGVEVLRKELDVA